MDIDVAFRRPVDGTATYVFCQDVSYAHKNSGDTRANREKTSLNKGCCFGDVWVDNGDASHTWHRRWELSSCHRNNRTTFLEDMSSFYSLSASFDALHRTYLLLGQG